MNYVSVTALQRGSPLNLIFLFLPVEKLNISKTEYLENVVNHGFLFSPPSINKGGKLESGKAKHIDNGTSPSFTYS